MPLPIDKKKMIKTSSLHHMGSRFHCSSFRLCQSLYDVKQKPQLKLCAPLAVIFLIANDAEGSAVI